MPNALGYLRHTCKDGAVPYVILGNVDKRGETIGWGMNFPNGPDPSQFAWGYCPWCAEKLPQTVAEWGSESKGDASGWTPFGIGSSPREETGG